MHRHRVLGHLQIDETHRDDVDIGAEDVEIAVGGRGGVDAFTFAVHMADRAEGLDRAGVEVDAVDAVDRVVGGEPGGAAGEIGALDAVHSGRHRERCQRSPIVTDVVPEQRLSAELVHGVRDVLARDRR